MEGSIKENALNRLLMLSVLGGLYFSWELLTHHIRLKYGYQVEPSLCVINQWIDCDAVAKSEYAELFGIPVASYGMFYYLILLGLSGMQCFLDKRNYYAIWLLFSTIGFVSSVTMAGISLFAVGKVCIFCFSVYLLNTVVFIAVLFSRQHYCSWVQNISMSWKMFVYALKALLSAEVPEQHRSISRFSVVYVLFSDGLVLLLLFFLVLGVYVPRAESSKNKDDIASAYEDWLNQPVQEFAVLSGGGYLEKDFSWGPELAPITIVEFSDFECPFCRRLGMFLKELENRNSGKIQIIYKNYPLNSSCNAAMTTEMHKHACEFSYLARCAGKYGDKEFWKMHDGIIGLFKADKKSSTRLIEEAGLNEKEMKECMVSAEVRQRVMADAELGNKLGINSTPSIFINGKRVKIVSPQVISGVIDRILQNH